ncbi:endopin-1 [Culex quinquefasciatus]|uniref:Endopin-1 n=1 Tax=Culex quinquefasciatus TaxID=7176 RepID=B0W998_CULQU|nr:endopin-1 [Culex quinquefasciatus]|eukprot:XP_001845282.1 endopin-1 [Culex quinquefasciatus]
MKCPGFEASVNSNHDVNLYSSSNQFTFEFFKTVYSPQQNVVVSPLAMFLILSMVYHVANEKASAELQQLLHLPEDKQEVMLHLSHFFDQSRSNADGYRVSNVIFSKLTLNPAFYLPLEKRCGTERVNLTNVDVVALANKWSLNKTADMFSIVSPATINLMTMMDIVMLNVISLNASWNTMFTPSDQHTFYFLDGEQDVEFMEVDFEGNYTSQINYWTVEIPYEQSSNLSMIVIIPKDNANIAQLVNSFTLNDYQTIDMKQERKQISLEMPKFSAKNELNLLEILMQSGVKEIFEDGRFAFGLTGKLRVVQFVQSAVIDVDETGTFAAAITIFGAIPFSADGGGDNIMRVRVNRPFMYLIRNVISKEIVFIGHYSMLGGEKCNEETV